MPNIKQKHKDHKPTAVRFRKEMGQYIQCLIAYQHALWLGLKVKNSCTRQTVPKLLESTVGLQKIYLSKPGARQTETNQTNLKKNNPNAFTMKQYL